MFSVMSSRVSYGVNLRLTSLVLCLVLVYGSTESTDRDSLLAFRSKISKDPLGFFNSWNASTHYCDWSGVTCSRRHTSRVTVLNLQSQQLEGTLSPHIGNLSFLRTLILQRNNFTLELPQEFGALLRLRVLGLFNNFFSGEIPTSLSRCTRLRILSLAQNSLGGKLPLDLGVLTKIRILDLSSNNFVGMIPPSLGNLSSLEEFYISQNPLHGSIPSELGGWKSIQYCVMEANELSGPIPESEYNLSSLTQLSLVQNKLNGSLPIDVGHTLPKLRTLLLGMNQFSGPIPASISNLSSLQLFHISNNRFTGKVPYFGAMGDLRRLVLSENFLGYREKDDLNFMSSLLNCTSLMMLGFSDNNFGGIMPAFLSNFSKEMSVLALGRNQIRGKIPTEIGNLANLSILGMEDNLLSGTIPSSIGKLKNLHKLFLSRNKLSGHIPSSIGDLSSISELGLDQNNLQGSIPPSMGGCSNLQFARLSRNNLSGTLPKELLGISTFIQLDLSENMLTGSLPIQMGKLVNLNYLNVSENNLSGEIPQTLSSCTSLEYLYLQGNFFHGKILSSLEALRGLQVLDLSRNNLSGSVPNYLENFDLLYLNLSWNDFEGQLPQQKVFNNYTRISVEGNKKLCGGLPELHLPSCSFEKSKPAKMKLIISSVCGFFGIMLASLRIFIYMSRRKRKVSAKSTSSASTSSFSKVSYKDLLKATDGFSSSNLIGVGGFGSVYKGVLGHEGTVVAVKVLNLAMKGAIKGFMAECQVLRNIRHRNLVKIITACSSVDFKSNDFKALVYEFMINGSLEDWLHPVITNEPNEQKYLSFIQRFNIIEDVANALNYMHNECQTQIVHCDLKPSNILLDEDMLSRVSDFGLARLCPQASLQSSSTRSSSLGIKGTIGYAAPEYGMGNEISIAGDVYSFGILLLEIFTGKRPTDRMFNDGLDLQSFAKMALPERVMFIADPIQFHSDDQFRSDKFWDCFISVIKLGVACSVESPRERTNMKNVVEELVHIKENLIRTGYILSFRPIDVEG